MTQSGHDIPAGELASADCVVVIPGFKKGALVVGVGHGRGFISCRNSDNWSSPAAITLDSGSLGVQLGGEEMDIIILSMDNGLRSKLLSDRFAIGSDASAAWGNGASAHGDPNAKIRLYGHTKGAFAGFDLDGASLKPDDSGNRALYGKTLSNGEIVAGVTVLRRRSSQPSRRRPVVNSTGFGANSGFGGVRCSDRISIEARMYA
jgi:lipid-binding SYLF domain-containing protein